MLPPLLIFFILLACVFVPRFLFSSSFIESFLFFQRQLNKLRAVEFGSFVFCHSLLTRSLSLSLAVLMLSKLTFCYVFRTFTSRQIRTPTQKPIYRGVVLHYHNFQQFSLCNIIDENHRVLYIHVCVYVWWALTRMHHVYISLYRKMPVFDFKVANRKRATASQQQ